MSGVNPMPNRRKPCDLPTHLSTASFWHSEPSPLLAGHRSTHELPKTADLVIVGSGITGASIAHHVLTSQLGAGLNVVMLEAREACWGATGRNGGHCQPNFISWADDPSIGHFELANYYAIQNLIQTNAIECEFVSQNSIHAVYSQPLLDDVKRRLDTVARNAPVLSSLLRLVTNPDELYELRVPTALGAVVSGVAARLWPYKFVARVLEDLLTAPSVSGSFNLQTLTPADKLNTLSDGVEVVTSRGTIKAKKAVIATNGYTSHLLREFTDLIVPCRGQMSALAAPHTLSGEDRLKYSYGFDDDFGMDDYLIQRSNAKGGQLMFGGGRRCGPSLGVSDDSTVDKNTAHYLRTQLLSNLQIDAKDRASPYQDISRNDKELEATYMWTGIMGYSRDHHPWVGEVPGRANLYIAAGFTGHGMPNTWLSGHAVAIMITKSLETANEKRALEEACMATGIPHSYIMTEERLKKANRLPNLWNTDDSVTA